MTERDGYVPMYYVLVGKTPIAVDLETWAHACDKRVRASPKGDPWCVARTKINDKVSVSTVFLGLDHNFFSNGDPVLFETMTFGGPTGDSQWRYCTWQQAERGHEEAVAEARKACAEVEAIAKDAGAKA